MFYAHGGMSPTGVQSLEMQTLLQLVRLLGAGVGLSLILNEKVAIEPSLGLAIGSGENINSFGIAMGLGINIRLGE